MSTATAEATTMTQTWQTLCTKADLVPHSGVAAWIETADGPAQVALFYLPGPNTPEGSLPGPNTPEKTVPGSNTPQPGHSPELYAVDHRDPFSGANVIARGIVGDVQGAPVVASPLYKQHFRLTDGQCLEDEAVRLQTWSLRLEGDEVQILA